MPFDLAPPLKLWTPPKFAIIRSRELPRTLAEEKGIRTKLGMLPGMAAMWGARVSAPKVLTYRDHDASESDLTTYPFTGKSIGTAAADRRVHAIVFASNSTAGLASATIGGVSATINLNTSGSSFNSGAVITALVPTGTTADFSIVWAAGQTRCAIMWWTSTGLTSDAALATASTVTDAGTMTLAGSVAGGFAIAGAWANGGSSTMSWGGSPTPTERVDTLPASMGSVLVTAADVATVGANQTFIPDWSSPTIPLAVCAAF